MDTQPMPLTKTLVLVHHIAHAVTAFLDSASKPTLRVFISVLHYTGLAALTNQSSKEVKDGTHLLNALQLSIFIGLGRAVH